METQIDHIKSNLKDRFRTLCIHKWIPEEFYEQVDSIKGMAFRPIHPFEESLIPYLKNPKLVLKESVEPVKVEIEHLDDFEFIDNGKDIIVYLSSFTNPRDRKVDIFPFRVSSKIICIFTLYTIESKRTITSRTYTGEDYFMKYGEAWKRIPKDSQEVNKRRDQTQIFKQMQNLSND